jgi:hypothetical protein
MLTERLGPNNLMRIALNLLGNRIVEGDRVKDNLASIVGGANTRDQAGRADGRADGARGGEASGDAELLRDVSDKDSIIV